MFMSEEVCWQCQSYVIHILTKFHYRSLNLLTFIHEYYPIYKITQWYLNMCYIWMRHLSFRGIRILSSCHKYLHCNYIDLVLGKYQYTEIGFADLEDELS
jgi:hypothetical protein